MPKQTFLNLPPHKRKAFLRAAIAEFAENDYRNASVSHLVAKLNIAKGSFYQYFENKQDLYLYLLKLALGEQIAYSQNLGDGHPPTHFFEQLQFVMEAGTRFSLTHPQMAQIIHRAMFGEIPFRDRALQQIKSDSLEYIRKMLRQGIVEGEIDPGIDVELIANFLNIALNSFDKLILPKTALHPQDLAAGRFSQKDLAPLRAEFGKLIAFLRFGLAARPHGAD